MTSVLKIPFCAAFAVSVLLSGWAAAVLPAQDPPALTADENEALQLINQRSITSAISFLASDELKGRGTGSEGLEIAGAYVASRFRAAGLKGAEDSFFQSETIDAVITPTTGIVVNDAAGQPLEHFGMLNGGDSLLEYTGSVVAVAAADVNGETEYRSPALLKVEENASPARSLMAIATSARRLKQRGATALIVPVSSGGGLASLVKSRGPDSRLADPRFDGGLPVLLVSENVTADAIHDLSLPAQIRVARKVSNVIGILQGSDPALRDEAVVFSAHLDHLGEGGSGPGDRIYNGADDNASGVTGVLALADAFGALKVAPKRTTIFVAYWGEERGLLGSKYLVENPVWPLDKIVANINLEMIGRPEPGANGKIWMTGWEHSDLGSWMNQGASRVGVEVFEHPSFSNRLYRASDNWSFVRANVIAHSFSAGSLHADYHQPGDEWEKLDLRHMTLVCKGLFAGALPLVNGEWTPGKSDKD